MAAVRPFVVERCVSAASPPQFRNPPNAVGAASGIAPKAARGLASLDTRTRCNRGIADGPFWWPGLLSGLDGSLEMSASEQPIGPRTVRLGSNRALSAIWGPR
jgi:hypothetical protein